MLKPKKENLFVGLAVVLIGIAGFLTFRTFAFVGPPSGVAPGEGSGVLHVLGDSIGIKGSAVSTTTLTIYSSSSDSNYFGLRINKQDGTPVLRVRGDGVVVAGNIPDNEIKTGSLYSLQTTGLYSNFIHTDNLSTYHATIQGYLDGNGTGVIRNFASIEVPGSFDGEVDAENINPGVFKDGGNFAFPQKLGVNTSTLAGLPQALSVEGSAFISGNVGLGSNIPGVGPATLNIKPNPSTNNWTSGISKAIRIEGNGAIEFGGGTGGTLYGMGVLNNKFFIFNMSSESGGSASYNLVMDEDGIVIGNISELTDPEASFEIRIPSANPNISGIIVGRGGALASSIRALGGSSADNDLVLNSTSSGKLYLNNLTNGNVIIGTGGGTVGIGTSFPDESADLDVAGHTKTQTIQITGGSPANGKVLTATDSFGNATWQSSALPAGSLGSTIYHNGSGWASSINLYNNNSSVGIGTTAPKGKLDVVGSIVAGTYAGVSAPPANSFIISGNIGVGVTNPAAKLEINNGTDSQGLRLGDGGSSIDLYAAVGNSSSTNGTDLCKTATNITGPICIGYWRSSDGASVGCGSTIQNGRALCADFGN